MTIARAYREVIDLFESTRVGGLRDMPANVLGRPPEHLLDPRPIVDPEDVEYGASLAGVVAAWRVRARRLMERVETRIAEIETAVYPEVVLDEVRKVGRGSQRDAVVTFHGCEGSRSQSRGRRAGSSSTSLGAASPGRPGYPRRPRQGLPLVAERAGSGPRKRRGRIGVSAGPASSCAWSG